MIEIEGAKRSKRQPKYNHIPKVILDAMAHRFEVGAEKYGRDNWKNGGPDFYDDCENHLVGHLWNFLERTTDEEENPITNLEAVMWNAGALLWWMTEGKLKWEDHLENKNEIHSHSRQSARKGKV
jgi:hypothetical protein